MPRTPIKVICVDDSPDIAMLLEHAVNSEPDMESVARIHDTAELIAAVSRTQPDVVVLDLTMPGPNPLDVLAELNRSLPEVRVIMYSGYDDPETIDRAVDAGAWGYLSKHQDMADLITAIRKVAGGELVLTRR